MILPYFAVFEAKFSHGVNIRHNSTATTNVLKFRKTYLLVAPGGGVSVHTGIDGEGNDSFSLTESGEWTGNATVIPATSAPIDCDGDGAAKREMTLVCRSSLEGTRRWGGWSAPSRDRAIRSSAARSPRKP